MTTIKTLPYTEQDPLIWANGLPELAANESQLANNITRNYRDARRNFLSIFNSWPNAVAFGSGSLNQWRRIFTMPAGSRVRGTTLRVKFYAKVAVEGPSTAATIGVSLFSGGETIWHNETIANASFAWYTVDITLPKKVLTSESTIQMHALCVGENSLHLLSVCAYCLGSGDALTTTLSPYFFRNDELVQYGVNPCAVQMRRLLCNQTKWVRENLVPSSNVVCHWLGKNRRESEGYGAQGDLGRYYFVKRAGIGTVMFTVAYSASVAGTYKVKATIQRAGGDEKELELTETLTGGAGELYLTRRLMGTLLTGDQFDEKEFELKFDIDAGVSGAMALEGFSVLEVPDTSSTPPLMPVPKDFGMLSKIKMGDYETMLAALAWQNQISTVACSDWRPWSAEVVAGTVWDNLVNCKAGIPIDEAFDADKACKDQGSYLQEANGTGMPAYCVLSPSFGSRMLRVTHAIGTTSQSNSKTFYETSETSDSRLDGGFYSVDPYASPATGAHVSWNSGKWHVSYSESTSLLGLDATQVNQPAAQDSIPYGLYVRAASENGALEYLRSEMVCVSEEPADDSYPEPLS